MLPQLAKESMPAVDDFLAQSERSAGLPKINPKSSSIKSRKSSVVDHDIKSLKSFSNSFKSRRNTVTKPIRDDDASSHFSGVLNTVTAEDIKYRDMEISTKTHIKKLRIHQQQDMEKLDKYDVKKLFSQTYGGTFTGYDPEEEKQKINQFTLKAVDETLQPKVTVKKEVIKGKKLPSITTVDVKGGFGFTDFYDGLFQNVAADGTEEAIPGKIISQNPTVDNLTQIEMAKHQAISKDQWPKYSEFSDKNFDKAQLKLQDLLSDQLTEENEDEVNSLIEDVWIDFDKQIKESEAKFKSVVKDEVNERLRQYLKANSQYISGSVERHIKAIDQGRVPGIDEKISNLGLLGFERQQFRDHIEKIRGAFHIEQRNLKSLATQKARTMMLAIFEDMKKLFKGEYNTLVEQYNQVRWQLYKLEQLMQSKQEEFEKLEVLNSSKDLFYDNMAIRFIDVAEGFEYAEMDQIDVSREEVAQANLMFNQVFQFYGGYAQLSANAKDQIGESLILSQFLHRIKSQKDEIDQKNGLLEASNKVVNMLVENSEKDMQRIYDLQDEVKLLKAEMALDKENHMKAKRGLYDDFTKENKKLKNQNRRFRGLAEIELRVQEQVVQKTVTNMEAMMKELKSLKYVMEIPRLRNNLKNYDFKKLDFQGYLKKIDELQFTVKEQMVQENAALPSKEYKLEKAKRENLKMNQTFNLTANSFLGGGSTIGDATARMNQTGAFGDASEVGYDEAYDEARDKMPLNKTHSLIKPSNNFLKKGTSGMRSTQVTLNRTTKSSSQALNLTNIGKGSESSRIFGSNFKHARGSRQEKSYNKTMLNNDSALKQPDQTPPSSNQKNQTQSNQNSKITIIKASKNFFRASSIGQIYNDPVQSSLEGASDSIDIQNNHTSTSNDFRGNFQGQMFQNINLPDSRQLNQDLVFATPKTKLSKSPIPNMSKDLKKNLNKQFGLNVGNYNKQQHKILGGRLNLGVVGTQGSHHHLGFTIGDPKHVESHAYTSRNNLASESSRQNIAINIQSGASLAMRGHVPHNQGALVLEGKFMDTGVEQVPMSPEEEVSQTFHETSFEKSKKQSNSNLIERRMDLKGISPFSPQSSQNQKIKQLNLEFGMFDENKI